MKAKFDIWNISEIQFILIVYLTFIHSFKPRPRLLPGIDLHTVEQIFAIIIKDIIITFIK